MDHQGSASGVINRGFAFTRVLPAPLLAGLILWLALLPGCNSQGNTNRQNLQQVRPISNAHRLVQNASYYKRTGRIELAVDELEQARLKEPHNLEILDVLVQCYEDLGDFDRAQELYQEALSRQGGNHAALENNRCYSLYLQGRLDQAESCFRQALARQPDNQKARNNLGLVLCRQGREAEALAMWREALSDGEARQRMGQALAALGKEVPPSLIGPSPAPLPQVAAAAEPQAPASAASLAPKITPPPAPLAGQSPPAAPDSLRTAAMAAQTAPAAAPGPMTEAPADQAALSASPAGPPPAPRTTIAPEPPRTSTPAVAAAPPHPGAAPATPPPASVEVKRPPRARTPVLTARDLGETRIEVKNGNGVQDMAREARSSLSLEGFNVVDIGNHIDFGLEETVIAYRPEAAKVARALARKFFPAAKLEEGGRLSQGADIRVSLGHDQLGEMNLARTPQAEPAAQAAERAAGVGAMTKAAQGKTPQDRAPHIAASSAPKLPDFLTAEELHQVRIELKNGNGISGQAWEMGGHLALEGFTVVNVGNHKDFGLEQTVITYRPEASRVAQVLAKKFFPKATLEEEAKLPPWTDVRVSLGRDLLPGRTHQMAQGSPVTAVP